jgi:hypothetical protein
MAVKRTLPPATEPLTVDEMKRRLHIDQDDENSDIGDHIQQAREYAENFCQRALITQKWDLFLDEFPKTSFVSYLTNWPMNDQYVPPIQEAPRGYTIRLNGSAFEIPFPPLQSVDSIKYFDSTGVEQTLDPSQYMVDIASEPGMVAPITAWPTTQNRMNAVKVSFTAGYGAPSDVPASIRTWMKQRVGALFENREEVVIGARITSIDLPFVDLMLRPYRIQGF